jgi:hypothetical protein
METTTEQRRYRRLNVLDAVVVTPNGHGHDTHVLDISSGGARVALPSDWTPSAGTALKVLFLPDSDQPIVLEGSVTRVTTDHLGIEFAARQDEDVQQLLDLLGKPA